MLSPRIAPPAHALTAVSTSRGSAAFYKRYSELKKVFLKVETLPVKFCARQVF